MTPSEPPDPATGEPHPDQLTIFGPGAVDVVVDPSQTHDSDVEDADASDAGPLADELDDAEPGGRAGGLVLPSWLTLRRVVIGLVLVGLAARLEIGRAHV